MSSSTSVLYNNIVKLINMPFVNYFLCYSKYSLHFQDKESASVVLFIFQWCLFDKPTCTKIIKLTRTWWHGAIWLKFSLFAARTEIITKSMFNLWLWIVECKGMCILPEGGLLCVVTICTHVIGCWSVTSVYRSHISLTGGSTVMIENSMLGHLYILYTVGRHGDLPKNW